METEGPPTSAWRPVDTKVGSPLPSDSRAKIDLIRTGVEFGWKLHCVLLDKQLVKMRTHYTSRTIGCTREWQTCYYCGNNLETRWAGYIGCLCKEWPGLCILDITPGIACHFEEYEREHGTLRGCAVTLYREKNKPTKRVKVGSICPAKDETMLTLPQGFNVLQQMFVIWQLKMPIKLADEMYHDSTYVNRLNSYIEGNTAKAGLSLDEQAVVANLKALPKGNNGHKS